MENFTFYAPTYFAFGKDTENDTGKYVKTFWRQSCTAPLWRRFCHSFRTFGSC